MPKNIYPKLYMFLFLTVMFFQQFVHLTPFSGLLKVLLTQASERIYDLLIQFIHQRGSEPHRIFEIIPPAETVVAVGISHGDPYDDSRCAFSLI